MKKKLLIDVDGVISNTAKSFCNMYNVLYFNKDGFVPADWHNTHKWDFNDECTLVTPEEADEMFDHKELYNNYSWMPDAIEVINKLCHDYCIIIATIGTKENLRNKYYWLTDKIHVDAYYGVEMPIYGDKSHIDMSGAIYIDDVAENLEKSNAEIKICFGPVEDWNRNWDGIRCKTWKEVLNYLNKSGDS